MDKIRLKGLIEEDFVNYKVPVMFLATSYCDFKCEKEDKNGDTFCQNSLLAAAEIITVPIYRLIEKYLSNPISKGVCFGGMEPFLQFKEVFSFIQKFREKSNDPIIIYTGYYFEEIKDKVEKIIPYNNIIIKYGRYKCNNPGRYDEILGIHLSSDNQYAYWYKEEK